ERYFSPLNSVGPPLVSGSALQVVPLSQATTNPVTNVQLPIGLLAVDMAFSCLPGEEMNSTALGGTEGTIAFYQGGRSEKDFPKNWSQEEMNSVDVSGGRGGVPSPVLPPSKTSLVKSENSCFLGS